MRTVGGKATPERHSCPLQRRRWGCQLLPLLLRGAGRSRGSAGLGETVGKRGDGEGGGWRRRLEGVRERTGGPRLPEGGSVPWARESLAGSLREKFPEAAVMETACARRGGQGEGASQARRCARAGKKHPGKRRGQGRPGATLPVA